MGHLEDLNGKEVEETGVSSWRKATNEVSVENRVVFKERSDVKFRLGTHSTIEL
jgi:hypothetical protein